MQEHKTDRVAEVMENPLLRVFGILFNPTSMLVALYLSSIGWSKVMWLQRIFNIFGRGVLAKRKDGMTLLLPYYGRLALPSFANQCAMLGNSPPSGRP